MFGNRFKAAHLFMVALASVGFLALVGIYAFGHRHELKYASCTLMHPTAVPSARMTDAPDDPVSRKILDEPGWHRISDKKFGWPVGMKIRSARGLAFFNGALFVGPRSDHGPCDIRYGQVLQFKNERWRISAGSKDTWPWPDRRIDRVNQLKSYNGVLYAALGGQYSELGAAKVAAYSNGQWRDISANDANFAKQSAALSLAVYGNDIVAGLGSPGYKAPVVVRYDGRNWEKLRSTKFDKCKYSMFFALATFRGQLYLGAVDAGVYCMAGVWRYTGTDWERVAGGGELGSWVHSKRDNKSVAGVNSLVVEEPFGLVASVSSGAVDSIYPVWSFDGQRWQHPNAKAPEIWSHQSFFDFVKIVDGRLYVGGGGDDAGQGPHLWRLDGDVWNLVAGRNQNGSWGPEPNGKADNRFIYELEPTPRGLSVVFGGDRPGGGDVWVWNNGVNGNAR